MLAHKMAAMMNIMIPIPTTKTTSFSYMVTKNRTSQCLKHVDGFALKSSPTDKNDVILSTLSKDELSSGGVSYMLDSASDVVRSFYDGINSRDLSRVVDLIAEDCVYEDLVFPKPIVGRKAILEFFEKFIYTISQDLQFVIDDISGEDTSAVGVTWHLACKYLRRKCPLNCIFFPYFPPNDPQRFSFVHRIYGASNVAKTLQQLPVQLRGDAAECLYQEAKCRMSDPVYGCVGIISQLQHDINNALSELAMVQADLSILRSMYESAPTIDRRF